MLYDLLVVKRNHRLLVSTTYQLMSIPVPLLSPSFSTASTQKWLFSSVKTQMFFQYGTSLEFSLATYCLALPDFVHPACVWVPLIPHHVVLSLLGLKSLIPWLQGLFLFFDFAF